MSWAARQCAEGPGPCASGPQLPHWHELCAGQVSRRFTAPRTAPWTPAEGGSRAGGVAQLVVASRSVHSERACASPSQDPDTAVDVVAELTDEDGDAEDLDDGVSEDPEEARLTPPAHLVETGGADWCGEDRCLWAPGARACVPCPGIVGAGGAPRPARSVDLRAAALRCHGPATAGRCECWTS